MSTDKVTNLTIFTTDWAKEDPRSVKAYLDGKGDGRVLWWNINRWVHHHFWSKASLEKIMFYFHSRHQTLTLRCTVNSGHSCFKPPAAVC